jgi:hypothetical protein
LRGRQKLPHPAAEPVSLHDSEIAANEVVDQVPMSTYGTKQTWRDVGLESVMRSKTDIDRYRPTRLSQDFRAKRDNKLTNLTAWIASFVRVPCR